MNPKLRFKAAFSSYTSAFALLGALYVFLEFAGSLQLVSGVLTTCYDLSGGVRPDVPCDQSATASACCGKGWGKKRLH